jgi:hypothetical protein
MSARTPLLGLFLGSLASLVSVGCGEPVAEGTEPLEQSEKALISANAQLALTWANGWISDTTGTSPQLSENVYTASMTALSRAGVGTLATNRTVCGTFVTNLIQKSTALTANDFYKSFNKAMDGTCEVGTVSVPLVGNVQKGTNSPHAAQYQYKISKCPLVGPIKFTVRTSLSAIEAGDVIAVSYPERTDINGHVMLVRSAPVADPSLPAGPTGSTPYAVTVIDSTSTPHGSSTTYPVTRPGGKNEGLGTGTFVLYADASGALVGSRWSPTDPDLFDSTAHPLAVGALQ